MGQKNCEGKDRKAGAKLSPFGRGRRINFALKQVSRTSAIAPKASFETSGEWSSLPFARKRRCAPHPPPKGHAIMRFTILLRKNVCNTFLHENGSFTSAAAMDLYWRGCQRRGIVFESMRKMAIEDQPYHVPSF